MEIKSLNELINTVRALSIGHNIYIWGTGVFGIPLGQILNDYAIKWSGYYTNYQKVSNKINEKPVFITDSNKIDPEGAYILTMRLFQPVKEQLLEIGIPNDNIVCIIEKTVFEQMEIYNIDIDKEKKIIRDLHNIYSGERCFLIGNGPSLRIEDLEKLASQKEISFACNDIYKCYNQTKWRPDYCMFIDRSYDFLFKDDVGFSILKGICKDSRIVFMRNNMIPESFCRKLKNIVYLFSKFSENEDKMQFSDDCSEGFYMGYTVAYAMMQMAVYMGFKEIFLIGMDNGSRFVTESEKNCIITDAVHSDILDVEDKSSWCNLSLWNLAYKAAKEYADSHGIRIFNATRGGYLEVFERVDFDSLFRVINVR